MQVCRPARVSASGAGAAVDGFAQQIQVAEVAGIFLDEVGEDPAQVHRLAPAGPRDRCVKIGEPGQVLARGLKLLPVCRDVDFGGRGAR